MTKYKGYLILKVEGIIGRRYNVYDAKGNCMNPYLWDVSSIKNIKEQINQGYLK